MRAPRYEYASPFVASADAMRWSDVSHHRYRSSGFRPCRDTTQAAEIRTGPRGEPGHHVRISSWPRIEIRKVEQKCPCETYGPIQRIVHPYSKRDQERGIVSKIIRVTKPDPGLQHQLGSIVGLGKIDPRLSLTGKPDLGACRVPVKPSWSSGPNDTLRCKNRSACKLNAKAVPSTVLLRNPTAAPPDHIGFADATFRDVSPVCSAACAVWSAGVQMSPITIPTTSAHAKTFSAGFIAVHLKKTRW